jgi:hypothetical protein
MKEWALKHPVMTFLLADAAIGGIVNVCKMVVAAFTGTTAKEENEEEKQDEPAGDHQ